MEIDVSDTTPLLVDLADGTALLNVDGTLRMHTSGARGGILSQFGSTSDGGTRLRMIVWTRGTTLSPLLLAVYHGAALNPRPPTPPPVVDCDDVVTAELNAAASRASLAVRTRP